VAKPLVVFDTNIFLRALINPEGINALLVASLDRFVLVSSPSILEEVAEVLSRTELLIAKSVRKARRRAHRFSAPTSADDFAGG